MLIKLFQLTKEYFFAQILMKEKHVLRYEIHQLQFSSNIKNGVEVRGKFKPAIRGSGKKETPLNRLSSHFSIYRISTFMFVGIW